MDLRPEHQKSAAQSLPVVPRLDQLDLQIRLLEKKHNLLEKHDPITEGEKPNQDAGDDGYKSVSTALEEVHFKGTLMDRIALLEHRVLQLSLQIEVARASIVPEKTVLMGSDHDHGSKESFRMQNELAEPLEVIQVMSDDATRESSSSSVAMQGCGYRIWRRKTPAKRSRKKLFEWLQI
ncbi:hypothetical protein QQ045_020397 [Rhodiola kirilowii]